MELSEEMLQHSSLRSLKLRNKETELAIQAVQSRINYMKTKEQKAVHKMMNVRRKLTSIESVRTKAKEFRELSLEERKKMEEEQGRKAEYNKLIKEHLKYNKKIVMTLLTHKIGEEARQLRDKHGQLEQLTHSQRESMAEENAERANKVRIDHIEAHEKRKMYFLDKLQQFKLFKEQRLREELKEREKQEALISELESKEKILLERLSVSERFKSKCKAEYEEAKEKYHSFYEATKGISRGISRINQQQSKAQVFIS